jgi:hypothetical protein
MNQSYSLPISKEHYSKLSQYRQEPQNLEPQSLPAEGGSQRHKVATKKIVFAVPWNLIPEAWNLPCL